MKRFLLVVLALAIVAFSGIALAEVDLDSMSKEELTDLYYQVSAKLFGQQLTEGVTLYDGTYIIGTDIPIGRYLLKTDGYSEVYDYAFVEGYDTEGKKVDSVLGRMTKESPGLLIDITEEVKTMRIGTSDNVQIKICLPSAIWTTP